MVGIYEPGAGAAAARLADTGQDPRNWPEPVEAAQWPASQLAGEDARGDALLLPHCRAALPDAPGAAPEPVYVEFGVLNTHRAVGTTLSHEVTKRFGAGGLPDDTIHVKLSGHAGQSLGAWLCKGITIELEGDANDYVGKGLAGGTVIVRPAPCGASKLANGAAIAAAEHRQQQQQQKQQKQQHKQRIAVGNAALFGAQRGRAFFAGAAGDWFGLRNAGVAAVVEGCGDHGCEDMGGGVVVVLGAVGQDFGAGMSGGVAYVHDPQGRLESLAGAAGAERGDLLPVEEYEDVRTLKGLIQQHLKHTGSEVARAVLLNWDRERPKFKKLAPRHAAQPPAAAAADADATVVLRAAAPPAKARLSAKAWRALGHREAPRYNRPPLQLEQWAAVEPAAEPVTAAAGDTLCDDCGSTPACQTDRSCPLGVTVEW